MGIDIMRTGRRHFLGGLIATGLIPKPTWADAGSPAFLAAAGTAQGDFLLCGLRADLSISFKLPLPARGHAGAGHPKRPEAVAFARRPGTFAVVINCATGQQVATLTAPEGRHFYGHGTFSADGSTLYTTENDYDAGQGRIGLWDAANGYRRMGEWNSGGVGPHDIRRLPGSDVLIVANGGIDTHPETGRVKLNIPTMRPNLTYIDRGTVVEQARLPEGMHKNSIRHLAVSDAGVVALGMQWEGDGSPEGLVATHRRGEAIQLMQAPRDDVRRMNGYIGSMACSVDGTSIAATSPRGNEVQLFDGKTGKLVQTKAIEDACGVATSGSRFVVTSGTGAVEVLASKKRTKQPFMFDNHLVALGAAI